MVHELDTLCHLSPNSKNRINRSSNFVSSSKTRFVKPDADMAYHVEDIWGPQHDLVVSLGSLNLNVISLDYSNFH